tara:strand:- start:19 stop:522 length:504 start_codon:yes stop_codon:yes gene_type:complete
MNKFLFYIFFLVILFNKSSFSFHNPSSTEDFLEDAKNGINKRSYSCEQSISFLIEYPTGIVKLGESSKLIYGARFPNDVANNKFHMLQWIEVNTSDQTITLYTFRYIDSSIGLITKSINSEDNERFKQRVKTDVQKKTLSQLKGEIFMKTPNTNVIRNTGYFKCKKN